MKERVFLVVLAAVLLSACVSNIGRPNVIYKNNFENGGTGNIANGRTDFFEGRKVLGRYYEGGFVLELSKIKPHDLIKVSFDLFIHDSWDGNADKPAGPDIWIMDLDKTNYIYTTFASGLCEGKACNTQSFPKISFPFTNNSANSNAIRTNLPGACSFRGKLGGTSMYRIERTAFHTSSTFSLGCFAQLEHESEDKACDESWSIDNLEITTVAYK